jgi:hypothetical protein
MRLQLIQHIAIGAIASVRVILTVQSLFVLFHNVINSLQKHRVQLSLIFAQLFIILRRSIIHTGILLIKAVVHLKRRVVEVFLSLIHS